MQEIDVIKKFTVISEQKCQQTTRNRWDVIDVDDEQQRAQDASLWYSKRYMYVNERGLEPIINYTLLSFEVDIEELP